MRKSGQKKKTTTEKVNKENNRREAGWVRETEKEENGGKEMEIKEVQKGREIKIIFFLSFTLTF